MDLEKELDRLQDENAALRAERDALQAWKDAVPMSLLRSVFGSTGTWGEIKVISDWLDGAT